MKLITKPPSQDLCYALAQFYLEEGQTQRSWDYLFCAVFYEMYLDGWFPDYRGQA